MFLTSLLAAFAIVLLDINIQYSSYLPAVFFGVGMSCFALRVTITTSFTEKIPQDNISISNIKFFNKSLEQFIIYSLLYGAASAILYPIFLMKINLSNNKDYSIIKLVEYSSHKIIAGTILILFLQYVLKKLLQITIITTQIINNYIDETNSRYLKEKYNKQE